MATDPSERASPGSCEKGKCLVPGNNSIPTLRILEEPGCSQFQWPQGHTVLGLSLIPK